MGRQVIKSFIKGLVTDGDSPDMPIDSMREMVNVDIDYSSQRLLCRYPYLAYNKLGAFPTVNVADKLYWVLKYDIGIEILQRNTLLVYRSTSSPRDWKIYSNAPNGGDGNAFELIAEEIDCSQCYPIAVNGNVRIALGNSKDYKIFMPHENLSYFKEVDTNYIIDDFSGAYDPTLMKYFKQGVGTYVRSFLYIDGRLAASLAGPSPNINISTSVKGGTPLERGIYDFIIAPFFDTNPVQYGAPIGQVSAKVTKDILQQSSNTVNLTIGYNYKVNKIPVLNYVKQTLIFQKNPLSSDPYYAEFKTKTGLITFYYDDVNQVIYRYISLGGRYKKKEDIAVNPQNFTQTGALQYTWEFYYFMEDPNLEYEVIYPPSVSGSAGFSYVGSILSPDSTNGDKIDINVRDIKAGTIQLAGSPSYTSVLNTNVVVPYTPTLTITNPTGYDLVSDVFPLGAGRSNPSGQSKVPGAQWTVAAGAVLIENADSPIGEGIDINIEIPSGAFNPRISEIGVFCKRTTSATVEADYSLLLKIPVRQTDENIVGWSLSNGNASYSLSIDGITIEKSLGFWSVLYSTGDGGFRPYGHTEADIRRKFGILVNRKERLYAGQIDDDEGQSIVAYTPVANGHGQMDVWFKPLIAFTDGSEANLWGVEFQDRLIWFQRNGLWHMDVGDKPRFEYQFHGVYRGTGCPMPKTVAKARDAMFFANYDGIFRLNSGGVQDITLGRINDWWRYEITQAQKDYSVGGYNPKTNEYWLIIPENVAFDTLQESGGYNDPNVDPKPFPTFGQYVYGAENTSSIILIWDNDNYYGEYWRWYRTGTEGSKDSRGKPVVLFSDRNNDWIFVDVDNNSYFWPGDRIDAGGIDQDVDAYPIEFSVATQNFGERSFDFIAERVQVLTEPAPSNDISVSIIRDSQTDAAKVEKLTFLSADRRPRKLQRKRCATTQIKIEGDNENNGIPEIREIVYDYFEDMKRP